MFCAFMRKIYMAAKDMHAFIYFVHLLPPNYIIMARGLLSINYDLEQTIASWTYSGTPLKGHPGIRTPR